MSVSIVTIIQQRVNYIELMTTCGAPTGSAKYEKLISDAAIGIMSAIKVAKTIKVDSAIEIDKLMQAKFPSEAYQMVMNAVNLKVNLTSPTSSGFLAKAEKQTHNYLDGYLTECHWEFFLNLKNDKQNKLFRMACVFVRLGLTRAQEKTYALGAALATHAHGFDVTQALEDVRKLKEYVRSVAHANGQLIHILDGPDNYPEDVGDFRLAHAEIYQQAFPEDGPVGSKWSKEFRAMVCSVTPCRDTKTGAKGASGGCITLTPPSSPMQQMAPFMQLVNSNVRHVLQPSLQQRCLAPRMPQSLLAITNGSEAEPAQSQQEQQPPPPQPLQQHHAPAVQQAQPLLKSELQGHNAQPQTQQGPQQNTQGTSIGPLPISMEGVTRQIMQKFAKPATPATPCRAAATNTNVPQATPKKIPTAKGPLLKRPSMASKKGKGKDPSVENKNDTLTKPPCPKPGAGKVEYKGAYIYTAKAKRCFRIIMEPPNYATERIEKWNGPNPSSAAWARALNKIALEKA